MEKDVLCAEEFPLVPSRLGIVKWPVLCKYLLGVFLDVLSSRNGFTPCVQEGGQQSLFCCVSMAQYDRFGNYPQTCAYCSLDD